MSLVTRAWIGTERLKRRMRRNRPPQGWWPQRIEWVGKNVPGKTVADIGGLFNNAKISLAAYEAGASSVTLMDGGDIEYRPEVEAAVAERSDRMRYVQGDLHDEVVMEEHVGVHDVVWCTGVLYHTPDPIDQLMRLRSITGELLYFGTHTIPEIPGIKNGCVLYPYLPDSEREVYATAYDPGAAPGLMQPLEEAPLHGHANFWWGITPSALRSMLRCARFEIIEEIPTYREPWTMDLVCRPIPMDPMVPPRSYFRERRQIRNAGGDPGSLEDYARRRAEGTWPGV